MFPEITRDDVFRLETRRLWLRWPALGDAAALAAIAGQKDTAEMTVHVPHPYPKGEASLHIERWRARNAAGVGLSLMLTGHGEDRTPFGTVVVEPAEAGAKIGLMLAPERRGLGLATEAMQGVVDAIFILTAAGHVEACARVVNPAARRVLERCGFAYEGTVLKDAPARGGMLSSDCFRLDRKIWASLKLWRMPVLGPQLASGGLPFADEGGSKPAS